MKQSILSLLLAFITAISFAQDTLRINNINAVLYTGNSPDQPLVVGLGGSEGGNVWAGIHWAKTRNEFLEKGYAFLAVGYFGCKGTPPILDRIAIEDVYHAIAEARKNKKVSDNKTAVIGGSRGADLALLLGSYYKDINLVVGMSSSNAVFPGHTQEFTTSCWIFGGKELPFIPVNEESVPFLVKGDLRGAFETMLKDTASEQRASIKVEHICGPVLLLSGTKDEIIPAVEMGEKMMLRLKNYGFKYPYRHAILDGTHQEPTKHFDTILAFLEANFKVVK